MLQQLLLFLLVTYASSNHFRYVRQADISIFFRMKNIYETVFILSGGSISWDIGENYFDENSSTVSVRVYQRYSWRLSWRSTKCDASTTASGSVLIGEEHLLRASHGYGTSESLSYENILTQVLCTDCSDRDNYISGEKYTILQLPINKRITYTYAHCCWIRLLSHSFDPAYSLNVVIDTQRRVDGK